MSRGKASSVPEYSGALRRGLSARSWIPTLAGRATGPPRCFKAPRIRSSTGFTSSTRCFHGVRRTYAVVSDQAAITGAVNRIFASYPFVAGRATAVPVAEAR